MDCFTGLVSFLFFVFTVIVCLVGLGMVGLASYWMVEYNYLNEAANTDSWSYVSIAVIILGVVLFSMGLLGCCGTCKKNKCLLYFFVVLLSVVVLAQIALVVYSFVERSQAKNDIHTGLQKTAEQFLTDRKTMQAWDDVQSNFKCCGAWDGPSDWYTVLSANSIPKSCCSSDACKEKANDCKAAAADGSSDDNKTGAQCVEYTPKMSYSKGCGKKLVDAVEDNLVVVGAVLLVFVLLQCLGILSAIVIAKSVRDNKTQYA